MSFTALQALKAYGQAASTAQSSGAAAAGPDFGAMVKDAVEESASSSAKAEQMTIAGASGQAEMVDVVTAISEAEISLETVVAVRDEMIKAYQDILRMPI